MGRAGICILIKILTAIQNWIANPQAAGSSPAVLRHICWSSSMVELPTCNRGVAGSSPASSSSTPQGPLKAPTAKLQGEKFLSILGCLVYFS